MKNIGFSCIDIKPGEPLQVEPKETEAGPPGGFVENTVKVYKLNEDGSKGELLRTMPAFPEGWDNPANFKHRPGQGLRNKEGEDNMKGIKTDENIRAEKVRQAQILMENGATMTKAAETLGVPVGTLHGWFKQETKKQQTLESKPMGGDIPKRKAGTFNPEFEALFTQTPNPEPVTAANQEPAQGVDKSAKNIIPEPVKMPIGCELPKKKDFTDADDQPIPYTVTKVDWPEVWPRAQELLSQGITQAAAAAELGISIDSLRHKIERERKKEQKASAVDLDTFKVRWIRDVMYEEGLDPSVQLQIVGAIQGLQITQG